MNNNIIDYGTLVDNAMHVIVKQSLQIFSELKDAGDHHFFISFVTQYPGIILSQKLKNRYPYEMTIILQYMFDNLKVTDDSFSVTLSFDNQSETIVIPFAALTAFADPSVKFGLQFRHAEDSQNSDGKKINTTINTTVITSAKAINPPSPKSKKTNSDNLITLDFRNKTRL